MKECYHGSLTWSCSRVHTDRVVWLSFACTWWCFFKLYKIDQHLCLFASLMMQRLDINRYFCLKYFVSHIMLSTETLQWSRSRQLESVSSNNCLHLLISHCSADINLLSLVRLLIRIQDTNFILDKVKLFQSWSLIVLAGVPRLL